MGRWGFRLFEGDQDLDIAIEIDFAFKVADYNDHDDGGLRLSPMIHQTDMCAPPEAVAHYQTDEYKVELADLVESRRQLLDSGVGDALMKQYRAKESELDGYRDTKYVVIIVGALMMRAGARINDDDLQHLRELVPQINCNAGRASSLFDEGFRGPGKAQFLAALANYKPGTPRSFQEPSCFHCGKTEGDLGQALSKCSKCQEAWYCSRDCQRAQWSAHRASCIEPGKRVLINV